MGGWPRRLAAMALVAALASTTVALAIPYQVVVVYLPYERVSEEHVVHWTGIGAPQPAPDPPAAICVPPHPPLRGLLTSLPAPI